MTITSERLRAIVQTREFLESLLCPSETPRVPYAIRDVARRCLRHYPVVSDLSVRGPDGKIIDPDEHGLILSGEVVLR